MDYLSTKEAARRLGISVARLTKAVWLDRVTPPAKSPSGNYLWTDADIDRASWVLLHRSSQPQPSHPVQTCRAHETAVLYTDGAAFPNPGHAAGGYAIYSGDRLICSGGIYLGHGTCNEAEYGGLIAGLEAARRRGFDHIAIHSDSRLIVGQVSGKMRCTKPHLAGLRDKARGLLRQFAKWDIAWTPRRENTVADELAKRAAQERRDIEGGDA